MQYSILKWKSPILLPLAFGDEERKDAKNWSLKAQAQLSFWKEIQVPLPNLNIERESTISSKCIQYCSWLMCMEKYY